MIFLTRVPMPPLCGLVEIIAYNQGYCPDYAKEVILPDGGIDLIIDLTDKPKKVYDNDRLTEKQSCRDGWISGMRNQRITIDSGKDQDPCMIVIRFKPGGAHPFFKFPLSTLADSVVDLEEVWGGRFQSLRQELGDQETPMDVLDRLEAVLLEWAKGHWEPDPCMAHAAKMLMDLRTPPTMKQLTDHIGYSQKHFIKLFETHIGLSPKRFSRIMRFQHIVRDLELGPPPSWSQFAQSFGFYDQAHFNNEFRAYAGITPTRYLQLKGEFLNYIPAQQG